MTRLARTKSLLALSSALAVAAGCGSADVSPPPTASDQSAVTAQATSSFFLHDGDTVVFFGDSISSLNERTWPTWEPAVYPPGNENYTYCMDIVSWATTQLPGSNIKFYDMAVPGETTAGDEWPTNGPHQTSFAPGYGGDIASHLRYIESLEPTVVTVDLGMNDGEYIANNSTLDTDFVNGIETIVSSLLGWSSANGKPLRIVVLAPSYFDYARRVATGWSSGWSFDPGYNDDVLVAFGSWEKSYVAGLKNPNVTFVDLNAPMAAAARQLPAGQSLTQEGIHPTWQGYQVIAATILEAWGAAASTLQYPDIQSVWSAFAAGQANIWNGNRQYVWTGAPITTGTTRGGAVNLTVETPQSLFWDSGNFQRGATVLQVFPSYIPNPAQDWAWTASGDGFTVCNTTGSPCLSDNGTEVVMGSKADILTITSASAVHDLTTGRYFQNPAGAAGSNVTTGTEESAWTFSSSLH